MSARAWYREPMLALVIGLPAAAVVAGIVTLVIAMRGAGDAGDPRVRRVAQAQNADLTPDRVAAQLALGAIATFDDDGTVTLRFDDALPGDAVLRVVLRHVTDPRRDRAATLAGAGDGVYVGRLDAPRAAGAHNVELAPADAAWRLVGRLDPGSSRLRLGAALEG